MRYAKITRDGSHCIMPLEMAIEEAKLTHSEGETGEKFEWENVDMAMVAAIGLKAEGVKCIKIEWRP